MDNLKELTQNVDTVIPLNGGVASVQTENHNPLEKEIIGKVGKYTGFPFMAKRAEANNLVSPGALILGTIPLNNDGDFELKFSETTLDGNKFERILNLLKEGAIMHLKDFTGKAFLLGYKSFIENQDTNGNVFYSIYFSGFAENSNYVYQPGEENICFVEFIGAGANADFFSGVSLKMFTNNTTSIESEAIKELSEPTVIIESVVGTLLDATLELLVHNLGIEVQGYELIQDYQPKIILERFTYSNKAGVKANNFKTSTNFKKHKTNVALIEANGLDIEENIYLQRPNVIDIESKKAYYDIKAENYFRSGDWGYNYRLGAKQYSATGSIRKKNIGLIKEISIVSNDGVKQGNHEYKKAYIYFNVSLQITVGGSTFVSKPMLTFRMTKFFDLLRYSLTTNLQGFVRIALQQL